MGSGTHCVDPSYGCFGHAHLSDSSVKKQPYSVNAGFTQYLRGIFPRTRSYLPDFTPETQ